MSLCHSQEAYTGWLWKPGNPTGEATKLLSKDDEWFPIRIQVVGDSIKISVKDELVMTYVDDEYKSWRFAIQCHNPGMTIEAKEMFYRDLSE